MRIALRLLIALNWTAAGFACYQVIYAHDLNRWSTCVDLAREDMGRDHPDLKFGTEPFSRRESQIALEYQRRTEPLARRGFIGWCVMMVAGTVTAIGLIAVFRKMRPNPPN